MSLKEKKEIVAGVAVWAGCFLFLLFSSVATSPLFPTYRYDSAIFVTLGRLLLDGGVPYLDIFDHKGCILFFLNAFGLLISGKWGILLLQSVFLCLNVLLVEKLVSLFVSGWRKFLALAVMALLIMGYYPEGNTVEEWSLLFILLPIFLYCKSYKEGHSLPDSFFFVCGLCFGVIAFIRVNDAVFLGFPFYALLLMLLRKEWKSFALDVLYFMAGFAIVAGVCCGSYYLLAGREGVSEMIYGTFIFNFSYAGASGIDNAPLYRYVVAYSRVILFLAVPFLMLKKDNTDIVVPLIICFLLGLISRGSRLYTHYFTIFIPLYLLVLSIWNHNRKIQSLVIALAIVNISYPAYCGVKDVVDSLNSRTQMAVTQEHYRSLIDNVPEEERNSIYNLDTGFAGLQCLLSRNLTQCNKIILDDQLKVSESLRRKTPSLDEESPLWILTTDSGARQEDAVSYIDSYYSLHSVDDVTGLVLYRKK